MKYIRPIDLYLLVVVFLEVVHDSLMVVFSAPVVVNVLGSAVLIVWCFCLCVKSRTSV